MENYTIQSSINNYFENISHRLKPNSIRSYRIAMDLYLSVINKMGSDPNQINLNQISDDFFAEFVKSLRKLSPSSQKVYLFAILGWYKFLAEVEGIFVNVSLISQQVKDKLSFHYVPKPIKDYEISQIIKKLTDTAGINFGNDREKLIYLRDKALLLILADTNLGIDSICALTRNNFESRKKQLNIVNDINASCIQLTNRLHEALREYLNDRLTLDRIFEKNVRVLPIFTRHDNGCGKKILGISPVTVRNIVNRYVIESLGEEARGTISPRSFKKYFVSSIIQRAFDLLHPKIISECQELYKIGRFDDAIFNSMKIIEEEIRLKSSADPTDFGVDLISKTMKAKPPATPEILFSKIEAEQESIHLLFRGAIGGLKNPRSHRSMFSDDPIKSFECLAFASYLLRMLDATT